MACVCLSRFCQKRLNEEKAAYGGQPEASDDVNNAEPHGVPPMTAA